MVGVMPHLHNFFASSFSPNERLFIIGAVQLSGPEPTSAAALALKML